MLKILWVSRHEPVRSQIEWLRRKFGEVQIDQDPRPFDSAEDIVKRYKDGAYDDMVVVAPLSVIAKLLERRIYPLWAEMDEVGKMDAEVTVEGRQGKRYYKFNRFRRIKGITMTFEELD